MSSRVLICGIFYLLSIRLSIINETDKLNASEDQLKTCL